MQRRRNPARVRQAECHSLGNARHQAPNNTSSLFRRVLRRGLLPEDVASTPEPLTLHAVCSRAVRNTQGLCGGTSAHLVVLAGNSIDVNVLNVLQQKPTFSSTAFSSGKTYLGRLAHLRSVENHSRTFQSLGLGPAESQFAPTRHPPSNRRMQDWLISTACVRSVKGPGIAKPWVIGDRFVRIKVGGKVGVKGLPGSPWSE